MVDNDPDLTTGTTLSRTQFEDHIPDILDSFARRLQAWPLPISSLVQEQEVKGIVAHSLHRWQQGFRLRELTREWGYLQLCVIEEIEVYGRAHPDCQPAVIAAALKALTHLCVGGVSDSVDQYWQLQQDEAAGHARDLEQALAGLNALEVRAPPVGIGPRTICAADFRRWSWPAGCWKNKTCRSPTGCKPRLCCEKACRFCTTC